jgi:hypothetical protein
LGLRVPIKLLTPATLVSFDATSMLLEVNN